MSDQDTQSLDRYLLGRLTAEESDALEARMLRDERFFELAETAEDDLVDRYARGELSVEDAKRFERHLLTAPRIRERVGVARALASLADRRERDERGVVAPVSRKPFRLAWAAALIATIAAGAVAYEVFRLDDETGFEGPEQTAQVRETESGRPTAVPPAGEPREEPAPAAAEPAAEETSAGEAAARIATSEPPTVATPAASETRAGEALSRATIFLALTTRGVAGEPERLAMGTADVAEIQLDLGRKRPSGKVGARVLRGTEVVWEERGVEVVTEGHESMARLVVPGQRLTEGRYRVEVTERADSDEGNESEIFATYEFSVDR